MLIETKNPFVLDDPRAQQDLIDLLNITPAAVLIVDAELKIRLANAEAESRLSISPSDVGRSIHQVFGPMPSDQIETCVQDAVRGACSQEIEMEDANGRHQLVQVKPFRGVRSWPECAVLVFQDIHELRSAQSDAERAHTLARSIVGTVPTPLVVLHEDLRVKLVNDAFHHHFGTQPADLEEQLFLELQENRFDLDGVRDALTRILEEQTALESFEFEEERDTGKNHVSITVRLIKPATDKMLLIALNDITARKEAEQILRREQEQLQRKITERDAELERTKQEAQVALQESRTEILRSREELRHLTASLLHAQDEERRRVSRELHDDLSQRVAKLQFEIEVLEQKVPFSNIEDAREKLRTVRDEAASLAEDLRKVAHQLHPSVLDHLGLAVALRSFINEFKRSTQIAVELSTDSIPKELPPEIASCAYRITQEALRNVAKHSRAVLAEVVVRNDENSLLLLIRDEGAGFNLSSARAKGGIGLVGMEERVRLVGGTVIIETAEDCGTSVRVRLPFPSIV